MKKLISFFVLVFFLALGTTYAQWTFEGNFPNDTFLFPTSTGGHGVAVDPDGKVWLQHYGNTDSVFDANSSTWKVCRALYVYNADGTEASFSPIKTVTIGGVTDTLYNSARGLRADADGNILASHYDEIFRINYQTGEGMGKIQPVPGATADAAAVDSAGNVYYGSVIPGNPLRIYTSDLTFIGDAIPSTRGYSRSFEVSNDGNTIYWCGFDQNQILIYSRPDEFSEYALTDSILQGFGCESATRSNDGKVIYFSAGSFYTPAGGGNPNGYPGITTYYSANTWYGWDTETNAIVDSIKWENAPEPVGGPDFRERARGLAFSPDGNTAYLTTYNRSDIVSFQKFTKVTSVDEEGQVVVDGYKLSQNYPNPFNPSTKINFELKNSGYTTLKVYDMLGNEVATLVQNELTSGSHSVNFNAASLASGTYVYQLNVNGTRITNKMVLLK
jgi:hypothetical protein